MFSFIRSCKAKKALAAALAATMVMAVAGCGGNKQQAASQATLVKSMQVIKRDTPIVYDYTGFVTNEEIRLPYQQVLSLWLYHLPYGLSPYNLQAMVFPVLHREHLYHKYSLTKPA